MKLRIPGGVDGFIGIVEFKNGVSLNTVSVREANLLRAVMGGVEILEDDGETLDAALNALSALLPRELYASDDSNLPSKYLPFANGTYGAPTIVLTPDEAKAMGLVAPPPAPAAGEPAPVGAYTRQQLEEIADSKGVGGLRVIAEPLKVKARSIRELIDAILGAQGSGVPAAPSPDEDDEDDEDDVNPDATPTE